jgi:hypothetical protein
MVKLNLWKSFNTAGTFRVTAFRDTLENLWKMQCIEERNTCISLLPILFACEINIKFNSMFFFFDENILYFFFFLQVWLAVLLCRHTPTYYGRIVVKILYTPAPIKKNCAVFKNVCIHQCVQRCVYMYIVRTRFYTNFYIVSKRKHNDQFSLKEYIFVKEEEHWIKFNVYFTSKQYRQQRNTGISLFDTLHLS